VAGPRPRDSLRFEMEPLSDQLANAGAEHMILWRDPSSGLEAVLVLDDLTLGPAAGGIRTWKYPSLEAAATDALRLAKAMTLKCALSGLDAGGGKAVILEHSGLDRRRAFEVVGHKIESLGGLFRTAGDLGTTAADLEIVARKTRFVHLGEHDLASAVARSALRAIEATCAILDGTPHAVSARLDGRTVAVQGAGMIGRAVAEALALAGARVTIADVDAEKAASVAQAIGATVVSPGDILDQAVDILAPCAVGGVIDAKNAATLRCRAVVGAANNVLASEEAAVILASRKIPCVPDFIASAGAVIDGIGASVMGLRDRTDLIDRLGGVTYQVLKEAQETGALPARIAEHRARQRIAHARATP